MSNLCRVVWLLRTVAIVLPPPRRCQPRVDLPGLHEGTGMMLRALELLLIIVMFFLGFVVLPLVLFRLLGLLLGV